MRSEHRAKTAMACVGVYSELRKAMAELAREAGVKMLVPRELHVHRVDHAGMELMADHKNIAGKAMLLAGDLPDG